MNKQIKCPHLLPFTLGRDTTDLCDIDGCPCDAERREMCNEKESEVKSDGKQTDSGCHVRRQNDVVR
jgi:hypothetical protein